MLLTPNVTMPQAEPAEHVRRYLGGDMTVVDALATRATRLALRTATALVRDREDAADIAQDVAVDVLRSLSGLREPAAFDGWVHRITVRHALRVLRQRRASRAAEIPLGLRGELEEPFGPAAADAVELMAAREALAAGLATLPPKQRVALALRYIHDLPDREVAAALDCRVGTAHALLSRGRATLRRDPRLRAYLDLSEQEEPLR